MLEILILCMVPFLGLAKRRPTHRRKYRRYIRGAIEESMALGTLATKTLIALALNDVVTERTFISSIVCMYSLSNYTPIAGAGPILIGVAKSDYTAAEIEEFVEQTTSWDEGDELSKEVGRRKIKIIGQLVTGAAALDNKVMNDGRPIKTKLGWILTTGNTIDLWAYNMGAQSLATTDPLVQMSGHANLFPT